jgi:hypothetical protein
VIEGWHYDPVGKFGGHTVTMRLVNHSAKDVTAFSISIAEKYADGSTDYVDGRPNDIHDHQVMEDMLGTLTQRHVWFAAGTMRDYVIPEAKEIASIEAIVDVVAYADGTADVLDNDRAFQNLVAERTGPLLAMRKTTEIIKRVLADPMISSPVAEVLRVLTPLADADQARNRPADAEFFEAMGLRNHVRDLESVPKASEREWLTRYASLQYQARAAFRTCAEQMKKARHSERAACQMKQ